MDMSFYKILIASSLLFTATLSLADLPRSTSPAGAQVYIVSPENGAVLSSPVTVVFGLKGMGVSPAGIEREKTGHHHLLVDAEQLPPVNVPMGAQVKHFGGGQTQTQLELSPGDHSLQLILGNHLHIPHDPVVASKKINITIK
jgi:hypothetical protein